MEKTKKVISIKQFLKDKEKSERQKIIDRILKQAERLAW